MIRMPIWEVELLDQLEGARLALACCRVDPHRKSSPMVERLLYIIATARTELDEIDRRRREKDHTPE